MAVDPEEGLVTNLMLGVMIAFGADLIIFVGIGWGAGFFTTALFVGVTVLVVAVFAVWIGWRWWEIRRLESAERDPVEELKYRYASGDLSEAEFERKLDALIDASNSDDVAFEDGERTSEKSN